MARYSFVGNPGGLRQVPSLGSYSGVSLPSSTGGTVPLPAVAGGVGVGGVGLRQILLPIITEIIGNIAGEAVTSAGRVATGSLSPVEQSGLQSASRYTVSPVDIMQAYKQSSNENRLRRLESFLTGSEYVPIDPEAIIDNLVRRNRVLMEEAGARERALEGIRQSGTIQQAYANTLGNALGSSSRLLESTISKVLERSPVEQSPVLAEIARAI